MAQSPIPNPASPRISIIVAYAANRVIGKDGRIPWHLSEDLRRFRQLTMGHHIVMGRKTWESIGRLLPGRKHIIISRRPGYQVAGARVVDSIDAAIAEAGDDSEIFIIGGGEIFDVTLPIADRIEATEINRDFEGDTFFPEIAIGEWQETARESSIGQNGGLPYSHVTLDRRRQA